MIQLRETIFFYYPRNNQFKLPRQIRLTLWDSILDNYQTVEELFQKDYITVFPFMGSTAKKHENSLSFPYRYYFKEANCQLHGQNAILLFNKSLSIKLIYADICSFLDPHKKSLNHAQICVSMSQINRLCSQTSKQYFKMQKPSLEQLSHNFTYCMPYLECGLDEYGYPVDYVRRTCLENSERWLCNALRNRGKEKYHLIFLKDKLQILGVKGEIEVVKDDENDESEEEEEFFIWYLSRLTESWPSVLNRHWIICSDQKVEQVKLNDSEFSSLVSSWFKENPLNSIIVIQPPDIDSGTTESEKNKKNKEKWRIGAWLWDLKFWRRSYWDPNNNKEQYCYAANLFETILEPKKKRKKCIQNTT